MISAIKIQYKQYKDYHQQKTFIYACSIHVRMMAWSDRYKSYLVRLEQPVTCLM